MKPIIRAPEREKKNAAYTEAYMAYKRGERKCPSRWEFGVTANDAQRIRRSSQERDVI
jgi:hypothetical protein